MLHKYTQNHCEQAVHVVTKRTTYTCRCCDCLIRTSERDCIPRPKKIYGSGEGVLKTKSKNFKMGLMGLLFKV